MGNETNLTMHDHEAKRKELARQVMHIHQDMILAVENAYAGEQMLAIFPPGWWRENAKHEQNNARLNLYNIIIQYEEARRNLRDHCIRHNLPQGEWKDGLTMVRMHLRQAIFKN